MTRPVITAVLCGLGGVARTRTLVALGVSPRDQAAAVTNGGVRRVGRSWIAGHRVDLLIGDRLVLQFDGSTHTGLRRDEDDRHDAELALLGSHVIRVGDRPVVERWHEVQDLVMRAVTQGSHLRHPR